MTAAGARPTPRQAWATLPWLVRTAVVWSACLVVVVFGCYLLGKVAVLLAPLAIAVAVTLFLTALLDPVLLGLRRLRVPAAPAALLTVLLLLGVLVGVGVLVWNLTAAQFGELSQQLDEGLQRSRDFVTGTLPVSDAQLDKLVQQVRDGLGGSARTRSAGPGRRPRRPAPPCSPWCCCSSCSRTAGRCGTGCCSDDRPNRTVTAEAGRAGWRTLGSYSRGTMLIAAIDALGIGLALVLLGVPLALPLALITFLGGFVPIIGATVAGAIAVLVALAANGPTTALLVLAAVIAVQQIEGNLLEPLVMKRQVQLHPAVILVVVTAGTLIAGIAGAFVSVPIAAVAYRVVDTVQRHREQAASTPPADRPHHRHDDDPPATPT